MWDGVVPCWLVKTPSRQPCTLVFPATVHLPPSRREYQRPEADLVTLRNQRCLIRRCSGTGDLAHGMPSSWSSSLSTQPSSTRLPPTTTAIATAVGFPSVPVDLAFQVRQRDFRDPFATNVLYNQGESSSHILGLTPWQGRAQNPPRLRL